jgi:hypothetical protein
MSENTEVKERRYIYMKKAPLFGEWGFLSLVLQVGSSERKTIKCRLHENPKKIRAFIRFKARCLTDIAYLKVDINNNEVSNNSLSLIPHNGEGFLYVTFELKDGMINDGINEIGFTFRGECAATSRDVIIQELEIRVQK